MNFHISKGIPFATRISAERGGSYLDFGYVRVSTKDQNQARQIKILMDMGIETAKEVGKYLRRPRVEYPENWSECYSAWKKGALLQ